MPLAPSPPPVEFVLRHRLQRVAGRLRAVHFHRAGLFIWLSVAAIAAGLAIAQQHRLAPLAPYAAPLLLGVFTSASALAAWLVWRDRTDVFTAARQVGKRYPELHSALQAAVEQQPQADGHFHFLQRRVIDDALSHSEVHDWAREPRREARWLLLGHGVALIAALTLSVIVVRNHRPAAERAKIALTGLEITPGDTEIERGATLVIAARFGESLPPDAFLVWQKSGTATERAVMQRSLSDPVYAFTLTGITSDVSYHIEYDGRSTRAFALRVYDLPALIRADADLDYPDYTGLADRHIVDTRRISAVVGTKLTYDFLVNKPLARAILRSSDQQDLALEPVGSDHTRFRLSTVLAQSQRFTLHLQDEAGRSNGSSIDVRIEALENKRPELKLTFPRGDQQVSPLEEMHLQAEARDDFGLRDYGFGIGIADAAPTYLSFAAKNSPAQVQANFDHMLALEQHGVKPDQLVTWFAWADDIGPDGNIRRTTSDVYFAQVRRLDEIFREDANNSGQNQNGPGGGEGQELLEAQRQISIATWKLRQADASAPNFAADAATLRDSQAQAQQQLATLRERSDDARVRAAADQAAPLMTKAHDSLDQAATSKSIAPLDAAWTAARGAYQALLRMQPRDTSVSQSRNASQSSSRSRSQQQLDELDFRNQDDRYETETQAQPPPTPEQREQLGLLARLRELARRQQDINSRLQELQTALAAAEDEAKREAIRRELKRLEEEQRRMLSETDEAKQRADRLQPGQQTQQVREQLEKTREDMRRASDQLAQGEVSQALAAGSRARENLQRTSEEMRKGAAGRFGDQMREARRQARELAAAQQEAKRQLDEMNQGQQSLDDSEKRESLAQTFEEQAKRRESLMQNLRQVTDETEGNEPRLHRQLYDLLRQQQQSGADKELGASAELLRRGFVGPAGERQAGLQREFDQLQKAVERAAGSVLGDETNELRFAQSELEDLTRELQKDRVTAGSGSPQSSDTGATETGNPGQGSPSQAGGETPAGEWVASNEKGSPESGRTPGQSSSPGGNSASPGQSSSSGNAPGAGASSEKSGTSNSANAPSRSGTPSSPGGAQSGAGSSGGDGPTGESLEQFARNYGECARGNRSGRGPLTGGGFGDWAERLRTVEELIESPEQRQQLANARFQAEELRRANQRDGQAPRWDLVEMGIVAPLQDARAWLKQELSRRQEPDALHPIDRDPVPERYAESVRKYYEALAGEQSSRPTSTP